MGKDQLFILAQQMFLRGAGRKAVMELLEKNGIPEEEIGDMTTEAYKSVRDEIQQMKAAAGMENANVGEVPKGQEGGGLGGLLIGFLLFFGGIALTMATDRIWYGAMVVGLVSIVGGIMKMAR